MNSQAYLLVTDDLDGPMNMALDEVLWREAGGDTSFVRLYEWADRPVLSLGYFQTPNDVRRLDSRLDRLPYVRRLTGGGAIVHDHEITYSLAIADRLAPPTNELYSSVHRAIAVELQSLNVPARVGPHNARESSEAGLCFHRDDRFAIRVHGVKILGSAQRRRRESVLMHGSLILRRSSAAPTIAGLEDLVNPVPSRGAMAEALVRGIAVALALELREHEFPEGLWERARTLARAKYCTPQWNDGGRGLHPFRDDRSPLIAPLAP